MYYMYCIISYTIVLYYVMLLYDARPAFPREPRRHGAWTPPPPSWVGTGFARTSYRDSHII